MTFQYVVKTGKVISKDGERDTEVHTCEAETFDKAYNIIYARHKLKAKSVLSLQVIEK